MSYIEPLYAVGEMLAENLTGESVARASSYIGRYPYQTAVGTLGVAGALGGKGLFTEGARAIKRSQTKSKSKRYTKPMPRTKSGNC